MRESLAIFALIAIAIFVGTASFTIEVLIEKLTVTATAFRAVDHMDKDPSPEGLSGKKLALIAAAVGKNEAPATSRLTAHFARADITNDIKRAFIDIAIGINRSPGDKYAVTKRSLVARVVLKHKSSSSIRKAVAELAFIAISPCIDKGASTVGQAVNEIAHVVIAAFIVAARKPRKDGGLANRGSFAGLVVVLGDRGLGKTDSSHEIEKDGGS